MQNNKSCKFALTCSHSEDCRIVWQICVPKNPAQTTLGTMWSFRWCVPLFTQPFNNKNCRFRCRGLPGEASVSFPKALQTEIDTKQRQLFRKVKQGSKEFTCFLGEDSLHSNCSWCIFSLQLVDRNDWFVWWFLHFIVGLLPICTYSPF